MELIIPFVTKSKTPLYEQIYAYIREEIRQNHLKPMDKLPSSRKLAEHLKVSRSTTQLAYEQLMAEGYIETVPCKGCFVARLDGILQMKNGNDLADTEQRERREFLPKEFLPGKYRTMKEQKYEVDFSPRGIDLDSFPYNTWRKITKNVLVDNNKALFLSGDHQGEESLRKAVGEYLHTARGVSCEADQIIIGAGNEYLLMLLWQILGKERTIAMENPTYKQAYRVFTSLGYQVVPVEMDQSGIDTEQLRKSGADLAYVMPSHQFPMGIVMPVKRRQELLQWVAEKKERYLIEDDYDSEFRYKGKPIPALQGMDANEKVIYMGTFSQSVAPAIRVGYMVLPKSLLWKYHRDVIFYSSTVSRIDQNILYQFLVDGYYERHLNRMRSAYGSKHDALLENCRALSDTFKIRGEYAGLHILLTDKRKRPEAELVELAEKAGIRVYGLSEFYIHPEHACESSTVLLGYANLTEEKIHYGIEQLIKAWKEK